MKNKSIIISLLAATLTIALSCKKFVDVEPPKTEILTAKAFTKDVSATSAVLGIYTNMQNDNNFISGGVTIFSGLSADELIGFFQDPLENQFMDNQVLPNNSSISSMWTEAYKNLAQINTCIQGLEESTTLTASVKAQLLGEAKFCRAFYNFYLVNLWGNIPLVTNTNYEKNALLAQSKPAEVYSLVIADLKDAKSKLSEAYPTDGKVRPNKWAAIALLARAYLYTNDYTNAEIEASAVISAGTYGPLPTLNNTFLKESKEAIWQLLPISNYSATQEGYVFLRDIPYGYPDYSFTSDLLNSFEPGDNRKTEWIGVINNQNQDYYYPLKYKDLGEYNGTKITENYVMLRLSEQYLIRAEARAKLNKLAEAAADVNIVRNRAGLNNLTANTQSAMLISIANENRHEFFAEWGHRWLDLKRTGTVNAVLSAKKPTWKASAALFPIPQSEIIVNKSLVQNPGY